MSLRIVYMGTSEFAVPSLIKLWKSQYDLIGVVTQPDRPRGRGNKVQFSPVKTAALEHGLEVLQPERIKDEAALDVIRNWEPDIMVVASYGQILPAEALDVPSWGCINLHASLLPHYRGAAPIQRAIMAGEKSTGVTTMFMDEGLDTGDIILQMPVSIGLEMDHGQVEVLLANVGADLVIDTMAILASGSFPRRKQDDHRKSYAPRLTREDEVIHWGSSAFTIHNQIRALSPQPGAFTIFRNKRLKIFSSRIVSVNEMGTPGLIGTLTDNGFTVKTGQGLLEILEVQIEGKNRISSKEFLKGFTLGPGDILS
jgi:methionyl-tRNA formyltransferase